MPDYVGSWVSTECDEIIAWVYDKNDLSKTVKVDVFLNDKLYKTYDANLQRPDLLPSLSNVPDATKHIFVMSLPALSKGNYSMQMRITDTGKSVGNYKCF